MKTVTRFFTPFLMIDAKAIQILAFGQVILLAAIWFLSPSQILPGPLEVVKAWNALALEQGLLRELLSSATTIMEAIILSTVISITISCLSTMAFFEPASRWITSLRFLGFAGITFLFTLMTSNGSSLKLWLLVFGMTSFLLTNLLGVVRSVTRCDIDYCRTLGLSPWRTMYEVFIRGKLSDIIDLIRQNAAIGWTLLSMVEGLVRSEGGIGSMLINQNRYFRLDAVFAIQLTILAYGIFQDYLIVLARYAVCPYVKTDESR